MVNRFKDAAWYKYSQASPINITVGGAGGIGSWLTLFLSRAFKHIIVYDYDIVEDHNRGGQLYGQSDVGLIKTDALYDRILQLSSLSIGTEGKFSNDSFITEVCFSAFDNMEARKNMFNNWSKAINHDREPNSVFIDGRLLAEQYQVFVVTPDRIDRYKEYLFSDEEIPDVSCTFKQTTHVAAECASRMVQYFTNFLTYKSINNDSLPFIGLPFMSERYTATNTDTYVS